MTEQEHLHVREVLNQVLEASYEKMLRSKAAMGESIITVDANRNPLEMSAEEALKRYCQSFPKFH